MEHKEKNNNTGSGLYRDPRMIGPDTRLIRETGGQKLVHVIDCERIADWSPDGLEPIGRFNPKRMKSCPVCAARVYPMAGAKDYDKNRAEYNRVFREYAVHVENLEKLYYGRHAKTQISGNKIYVSTRTDKWEITFCGDGKVELGHGNYKIGDDEKKITMPGYHEHVLKKGTLDEAIKEITNYKYEEARKYHRAKHRAQEREKKTVRDILAEIEDEEQTIMPQ